MDFELEKTYPNPSVTNPKNVVEKAIPEGQINGGKCGPYPCSISAEVRLDLNNVLRTDKTHRPLKSSPLSTQCTQPNLL
jgi:hypothetical protein